MELDVFNIKCILRLSKLRQSIVMIGRCLSCRAT